MSELLPCPFCGGAGDYLETGVWWVRCDECGADAESGPTREEAARLWNRRAPSPSPAPGVDISDPYMRIVMMFDRDETAGSFLSEDGEGGFAGAVYRMAREIDMLRAYIEGAPMQNPVRTLDLSNLLKHAFSAGYVSAAGDDGWTDYDPEQCAAYHRVSAALASLSQPTKGERP